MGMIGSLNLHAASGEDDILFREIVELKRPLVVRYEVYVYYSRILLWIKAC